MIKNCVICGKTFECNNGTQLTCSYMCAKERAKVVEKAVRRDGTEFGKFVASHYPADIVHDDTKRRKCLQCGEEFKPYECVVDKAGIHPRGVFFCSIQCCMKYDKEVFQEWLKSIM